MSRLLNRDHSVQSASPETVKSPGSVRAAPRFRLEGKSIEPFRTSTEHCRFRLREDAQVAVPRRPRLAYRDVASATNRLTLIAAVLPADCVSLHTIFCLRTPLSPLGQYFLCGLFNSLVVNFLVRLRVTTHVTTATVERLPIPTADAAPGAFREIAALARLLSRRDDANAVARLNASVAQLYQLSVEEFEHVLTTFPLVPKQARDEALKLFVQDQP